MDSLLQDLRFALRTLLRAPGFTAAAVLAFALGVGGSTAIFSVLDGVALRPLAVPEPDRLVRVYEKPPGQEPGTHSIADYLDVAKENGSFESVAAVAGGAVSFTTAAGPEKLPAAYVTASFFAVTRVNPALGRGFSQEEDVKGPPPPVVLTDEMWRSEFGGDRRVLGQTLELDGRAFTVVGVLPRSFRFPLLRDARLLLPFQWDADDLKNRGAHYLRVFARLKPGVSVRSAQAELDVLSPRFAARLPELHTGWRQEANPLLESMVGRVKPVLQALLGAVALVLLTACANVASMLLARGAARQRELAIRTALGSGRARIVRQLLTEALLLALAGGALGVLLAAWGVDGLLALAPRDIPRLDEVRLDGPVLLFTLGVATAAGIVAGLLPALQASRPDLVEALKDGAAGATSRGRARSALVVAEIALALVLVVGAGLMIRSLKRLLDVPTGLADPAAVLTAELILPPDRYEKDEQIVAFYDKFVQRAAALPGVKSVALSNTLPLDLRGQVTLAFAIEGAPPRPAGQLDDANVVWVTPDYRRTMGIPLLRGRDLGSSDVAGGPLAVLVNQSFVDRYFPGGDAIGRRLVRLSAKRPPWQIVGVVADVRAQGLDQRPEPQVLVPLAQWAWPQMNLVVRTARKPTDLVPLLRTELAAIDKDQPLAKVRTLEQIISASVGQRRFQMTLLTIFGLVALLLASLGIYGVMAYSVAQRSREIGIRMALGARGSQVLGMVIGGGLRLAAIGVGIGLIGALALTHALQAALFQVSATDPLTLAAVSALLVVVAAAASWAPARRATRVDPMLPLRAE